MAKVRPFKGFRPLPKFAAQVASRPYDVLNSDEARQEAAGNPISFLHVGKPEIDLPQGVSLYDDRVYQKGRENLEKLLADGIFKEDSSPCFYLYAQTMGQHTQVGIVGCASVEEYLNDKIKKHELTRKDKEDDRTKHVRVTNAHTGPIFLTYRAHAALDAVVASVRLAPPENNFTTDDGVKHQLWVISGDEATLQISKAFLNVECLYIADGHHRAAAAARVASELKAGNPGHTGNEEYNYFLAVLFPENQLRIMDYNRLVTDLNGLSEDDFKREVAKVFTVLESVGDTKPDAKGEFKMFLGHRWYDLKARPQFMERPEPLERLDVSILQDHLLGPVLGIKDPRTDKRIDFVGGIRGLTELQRRVQSGEMKVGFALHPTSINELLAIADAGKIMPPKSTWFEPKLRDGIVVHYLS